MSDTPNRQRSPSAPNPTPQEAVTTPSEPELSPSRPKPDEATKLHPRPDGRPEGVVSDPDRR